jgi:hypothetical protein
VWTVKKPKAPLPPGEYVCKVVDASVGPDPKSGAERLTLTVSVPALGGRKLKVPAASFLKVGEATHELSRKDIERLAQTAWENTGKGDLPVLPPGHGWVDQATGQVVAPEDLVTTWEKVTTKDIFRRQAAAVAKALGFKLADDVLKPRDFTKGGGHA